MFVFIFGLLHKAEYNVKYTSLIEVQYTITYLHIKNIVEHLLNI